jgi:membrane associated rhomboid family serine protease
LGANLLVGLFVFFAVGASLGVARGWSQLALAAVLGNCACAALHYRAPYESLGASTAIFAGFGLLTGRALRACLAGGRRWQRAAVPAGGGVAFLGLYGSGGGQTDVLAHATGFAAGLLIGFGLTSRADQA